MKTKEYWKLRCVKTKKYKVKKRKMPIKTVYIFIIILVICVAMATGYSIFSTELKINGTAIAKLVEQEIVVPPKGQDDNGVDRFSASTKVENLFGM